MTLDTPLTISAAQRESRTLRGIAASPGIAIGPAVSHHPFITPAAVRTIPASQAERQVRRFDEALRTAEIEILELRAKIREMLDEAHASIFDPHLLFVKDPALREQVTERIRVKHEGPQYAVMAVINDLAGQFAKMGDAYISSRATDVFDVGRRICRHLAGGQGPSASPRTYTNDVVIFAHDLTPSDTAQMDHGHVKAFATEVGGPTSHTAILAKALGIPAIVGLGASIRGIGPGTLVIVDGYAGTVTVDPTPAELKRARARKRREQLRERDLRKLNVLPAETVDGYRVELSANIELTSEIAHLKDYGAQGIGLFRTEFLYLQDHSLPSEEKQFEIYRQAVEGAAPGDVIFRTLDLGGDKLLAQLGANREANPFLGLRAIRLCLSRPQLFLTQLRALLRASVFGKARIMFPMVSSASEIRDAKALLETAKAELRERGQDFDEEIEVGVMIEVPSAALVADQLASEVDFFSIGTNDLIQYTLAVDRSNERVAHLYDPYHPAVLRLIRQVIDAGHRAGIWIGVCGEMASNPVMALMLVGMGIDELSMGPSFIPQIKYFLRHIRLSEARRIAGEISSLGSSQEIRQLAEIAYGELLKRRIKMPIESQ